MIEGISAVTLGTHETSHVLHQLSSRKLSQPHRRTSRAALVLVGRVIFYVADVDALYDRALAARYQPATAPRDAEWGERSST
jgi:hypothetical protein